MKSLCDDCRCRSGSGVYEHPARCSPDGTGAAACRTEFEFLLVQKKFMAAPSKLQLVIPLASRQYGSGPQVVVADLKTHRRGPMPCDCSRSRFDRRSHYNMSYVDIVSIAAASGLRSFPVYVRAEDSQRGFHLRRTASRRGD
jgi:hypothetical protein